MILLLFIGTFVYYLTQLPSGLPNGVQGYWAVASWTLDPIRPAVSPLPLLWGKLAVWVFPVGSPSFRMNVAGAFWAALAAPLALNLLTWMRPRFLPGPALLELEEERRWNTASLLAVLLWALSPPVLQTATGGFPQAVHLFFPLLAAERFLRMTVLPPGRNRTIAALAAAAAGALALTLDLRWILLLPGLLALKPKAPSLSPNRFSWRLHLRLWGFQLGIVLTFLASFLLPWVLLSAFQSFTVEETLHRVPALLWSGFPSAPMDKSFRLAEAVRTVLQSLAWAGIPAALWGAFRIFRGDRARGAGLWLFFIVGGILPPLLPGPEPTAFPLVGGLAISLFFAWGMKEVMGRTGWVRAVAYLLIPLVFLLGPLGLWRIPRDPARAADLLRSLPAHSLLAWERRETAGALLYEQTVWGRRPDVRLLPDPKGSLPSLGADQPFFVESPTLLPSEPGRDFLPMGFAFQPLSGRLAELASPLETLTAGRTLLSLAESRAPSESVRTSHTHLGEAFARLRAPDQAEAAFLNALAAGQPESRGSLPPAKSGSARLGRLLLDYGDGRRAAAAFERSLRHRPRSAEVLADWASAEVMEGRLSEAVEHLREALRWDPTNETLRARLADLYERSARPQEAAAHWQTLADAHPQDRSVLWRLTQAWMMAGEPIQAHHAVERYLQLSLNDEERGNAETFKRMLEESISKKLLERTP